MEENLEAVSSVKITLENYRSFFYSSNRASVPILFESDELQILMFLKKNHVEIFLHFRCKIAHLKTHVTRAHPKYPANLFFKCSKCPTAFNEAQDLDRHYINVHRVDKKRNYRCPNCPKVFYKKSHFQMHLSSHSADRPYTCHICPDVCFKFKSSLLRHFKISHKMESPDASLGFDVSKSTTLTNPTFYDDNIHCEDVIDKNEFIPVHIHQCDKCPKTYRHEGNLARHFVSEHKPFEQTEDKTGFNCDKCNTFFAKEKSYKHHLAYYHNEYDGLKYRLFRCSICDLKFCTKRSFQMHMSDVHQVKKYMVQCEVCAKTFVSKHGRRLHIAKVHEIVNS
ncbi:unnamed protein product [Allacma fusca]|uniref:C2H2-type domain-containing protein n=1 Tax=Allacma fusca TaxID=39272 RepID=A0A8J2NVL4_9HEXA|nr:unnamed protein product [Allacma fusca]